MIHFTGALQSFFCARLTCAVKREMWPLQTGRNMATQYFTMRFRNVLLLLLRSVKDGLLEFPFSGIVLVEMHATSRRFKYLSRTRFLKFFIVEEML